MQHVTAVLAYISSAIATKRKPSKVIKIYNKGNEAK